MKKSVLLVCVILLMAACSKKIVKPEPVSCQCPESVEQPIKPAPIQLPKAEQITKPNLENIPKEAPPKLHYDLLQSASWQDVNGLQEDNLVAAWPAWLQSCSTLIKKIEWKAVCELANTIKKPNNAIVLDYLTTYFDVYRAHNEDGSKSGLITGYYQPLLLGSRKKTSKYPYPLYGEPEDLISVELADAYPELRFKRVRGKLEGKKLIPYRTRAEIDTNPSPLAGTEILWINDIIDVFFLQIQGSGVVQLESGEQIQVGYANHNGHAYQSIGRLLVERGELTLDKASMQGIKDWARNHLDQLQDLLNSNPSYVFFRELPAGLPGPLGALGVPIFAERSVAVDREFIPLGAPIFLSTTEPNSSKPLKRLMLAQDTGGAIKGGVRADFFWGAGDSAGAKAGAMKQQGQIWVLLPKGFEIDE